MWEALQQRYYIYKIFNKKLSSILILFLKIVFTFQIYFQPHYLDDLGSGTGHLPHMPAYADTEYEYFEQRGGFIRPTMTAGGGGMLGNQGGGMIGHHQLYPGIRGDVNPHMALGGQLLATETAKLDNRQEEVDDVLFFTINQLQCKRKYIQHFWYS